MLLPVLVVFSGLMIAPGLALAQDGCTTGDMKEIRNDKPPIKEATTNLEFTPGEEKALTLDPEVLEGANGTQANVNNISAQLQAQSLALMLQGGDTPLFESAVIRVVNNEEKLILKAKKEIANDTTFDYQNMYISCTTKPVGNNPGTSSQSQVFTLSGTIRM